MRSPRHVATECATARERLFYVRDPAHLDVYAEGLRLARIIHVWRFRLNGLGTHHPSAASHKFGRCQRYFCRTYRHA